MPRMPAEPQKYKYTRSKNKRKNEGSGSGTGSSSSKPRIVTLARVNLCFIPALLVVSVVLVLFGEHANKNDNTKQNGLVTAELTGLKRGLAEFLQGQTSLIEALDATKSESGSAQTMISSENFYNNHRRRLQDLLFHSERSKSMPYSNFIVWGTRDKQHPFAPIFDHFDFDIPVGKDATYLLKTKHYMIFGELCKTALTFVQHRKQNPMAEPKPHVLLLRLLNENWGGLSDQVRKRNGFLLGERVNLTQSWLEQNCTKELIIEEYLGHPDTRAIFTFQHQFLKHPKAFSLPLGIKADAAKVIKEILGNKDSSNSNRTQLLMINSQAHKMRKESLDMVTAKFRSIGISNTFDERRSARSYFDEMSGSKFILSPAGMGFDAYRHWEAMYVGTIPVIEHWNRTDGWYRVFEDLPVAWIDSYENLTPEWLETQYIKIIQETYNYEKLTMSYWIDFVNSFIPENHRKKNVKHTHNW